MTDLALEGHEEKKDDTPQSKSNDGATTQAQPQKKRINPNPSVVSSHESLLAKLLHPTFQPPHTILNKTLPSLVLRQKLNHKQRHLVIPSLLSQDYLNHLFSNAILPLFDPQTVHYNGGVANVKEWKISCYLEVMAGGVPTAHPHQVLMEECRELLDGCDALFRVWYRQQHPNGVPRRRRRLLGKSQTQPQPQPQNGASGRKRPLPQVKRLMTFITRYTPAPGESALLKHVDGAGKVDGSVVVALPMDQWSEGGLARHSFEGHGGGLTFWDGRRPKHAENASPAPARPTKETQEDESSKSKDANSNSKIKNWTSSLVETHYDTRCGDVAFIDCGVWHQADPITRGTRWALVIFYEVLEGEQDGG